MSGNTRHIAASPTQDEEMLAHDWFHPPWVVGVWPGPAWRTTETLRRLTLLVQGRTRGDARRNSR